MPTAKAGSQGQSAGQPNIAQLNRAQRFQVLNSAVDMCQQIYSQTINPATQVGAVNISPRNVGLVKRFIVKITGTANNTDAANVANLSDFGLANLLSQVVFLDLNNNTRIQTTGWHLHLLSSVKHRQADAEAILSSAVTEGSLFGDNFGVIKAPTGIAHATSSPFQMYFEVPLAYSDEDLRGAVYMNVVNATASLQLTLNTAPFAAAGADSTSAVWKGAAGNISNVTITVYQEYLDQLPQSKNGVILPSLDLATVYELKNTTFSAIVAANDFPMPYANFRDFLSTFLIYNHDPSADAGRVGGTDINYLSLQSANFTNIFKVDPQTQAYKTRKVLRQDLPLGGYYFSTRRKPLSTTTYGNMELILNPITAAAGAYALIGWEDFALTNILTQAGSLAG